MCIIHKCNSKKGNKTEVYNLGWNGDNDGFQWWIIRSDNDEQLTNTMSFSHTGHFKTPYKVDASYYKGWKLKLRMKTDWYTNHPCDVDGAFTP